MFHIFISRNLIGGVGGILQITWILLLSVTSSEHFIYQGSDRISYSLVQNAGHNTLS
jgi:hypothetical protein